ncbi:MAG TPA: DNA integrity scanning diadenylate cyclase DisA [Bacillales bacterium]|nr:DNA integrity scanning diadenylate cyclase DisA [Bacillales bacterium]
MDQNQISEILQFVAPGTPLREGIDNVLRAKTGGLIVVGFNDRVEKVVEGGFSIDCPFSPAALYELAKMDGAIILNGNGTRILRANTQLIPDSSVPSNETGIRHRSAERVAIQTATLVISISQRRDVVTLYREHFRYTLNEIGVMLAKANQAIQTLEKYKTVLDQGVTDLGALEFEELVTFQEVTQVLHRIGMVLKIKNEIGKYVNELGTEGRLIKMQMQELVAGVEKETIWLIRDYARNKDMDPNHIMEQLGKLSNDELMQERVIMKLLGYPQGTPSEESIYPRGYRILHKIPRLPSAIVENLTNEFDHLNHIMKATINQLDDVDGIGEIRARKIKHGLERIQEQLFVDRNL